MELTAQGLTKRYGNFTALSDVSFSIKKNGCYGYLGPNGAGKTTTMKLFTNLLHPTSGAAIVNGINVNRRPLDALKNVSSLVEDPLPYDFMTVREFVSFAAKIRGVGQPDLGDLKDRLDLPDLDKSVSKLSKGQKRRVYLAALAAQESEILILDEPTSGLDPKESIVIRDFLRDAKGDKIILLSSHLLYEVSQVCDYVYFLYNGRLTDQGTLSEIQLRYTSKVLRVEFFGEVDLKELGLDMRKENGSTYLVYFDGSDQERRRILDRLYPLGLRSFGDAELGLEEAYRKVIG
ncbi:MAG: ABC transporter ATP-binding protein [Thermoprotei archaeon]